MNGDRLESWKEIAAYLGREVRTVQLWEKSEALPIHRHQHARQGSVYAFKSELDAWRNARRTSGAGEAPRRWGWVVAAAVLILAGVGFWTWKMRRSEAVTSVVVLPFSDFSPQHDQEYFSDGLTEELIDALSRVPNLRVVARTSAFSFKGRPADIREIGRQLNVGAVIEGSVRKSGDQIRITAQLNRVSDGTHLWSRTYDRQLRDIFAVQREISQSIANQLRAGASAPAADPTSDVEAYRLYEEGRFFFAQFQPPGSNLKAIERYQQAIARDPKFVLAYVGLSEAYAYLAENFVLAPREVMPKAKAAAEKAVELDANSAEAHTALAAVKLDYDWDQEGAARELHRALEIRPGLAWAQHWYAHSLEAQGKLEEALKQLYVALSADPLSIPIRWDIGNELIAQRRYDEALRHLAQSTELFPNVPLLLFEKSFASYGKGDVAGGDRVVAQMKAMGPEVLNQPFNIAFFGMVDASKGRRAGGRAALDQLEKMRATQYVDGAFGVGLCEVLGDQKARAQWLQRMQEERSSIFLYLPMLERFWAAMPHTAAGRE
jgi:TolB-like protein/Tfp pilus assembly protein PilF